ncbi:bifunctional riboflavin kinase/FAD synthetase [Parasphingorhabdus halotolerans]|uniref:Riboflavin biosynthesis protein n=1 Tax=Parasphingorhabdus halotolerans TaxID=2725558 RepID=A0A6H2DQF3_9SPHN|nr:bifunctional riboflavin kinase/FAD synthetase [Parasphingorhabdus halotolerans]QJB69991.1 bifunctional riboflavin kinase/FAD synthetase [Parasphingorhabdus halotolerans]
MTRLSGHDRIEGDLRGAIIALGNFDGFHKGHQAVAKVATDWAQAQGRPAIIATFDPHPVRHFTPDAPPFRLTTLGQRERLFKAAGADAMLVFEFGAELAGTTAEDFVAKLLVDRFGAAGVVTGEDFTFGKGRAGNVVVMAELGKPLGLSTKTVGPVSDDNEVISSSRIRDALKNGDCETANALLTRPFAIEGEVIHGDKNGRLLGYPTANIDIDHYLRPKYGIYAVKGKLPDGRILNGAANLGIRPTFDPPKELLEPYFFDFNEDLYGKTIEVELHHFLRGEQKFDDLDELKTRMERDCHKAREYLA